MSLFAKKATLFLALTLAVYMQYKAGQTAQAASASRTVKCLKPEHGYILPDLKKN